MGWKINHRTINRVPQCMNLQHDPSIRTEWKGHPVQRRVKTFLPSFWSCCWNVVPWCIFGVGGGNFWRCFSQLGRNMFTQLWIKFKPYNDIHDWAKEWSLALGCVNSRPAARGSQEAEFTQPRDHSFAERCTYSWVELGQCLNHFDLANQRSIL